MKTEYSVLAGAVLLTLANGASAQEPLKLSDVQMDEITAGAAVLPIALAVGHTKGLGYGTVLSGTSGAAYALTDTLGPATAFAKAYQTSVGISAYTPNGCGTCGAVAQSVSTSAAHVD